jgi:putative mRNA 3-end processing factor
MLTVAREGLFCPAGGFYIDPWEPVEKAIITHGHADHARPGSGGYFSTAETAAVMGLRFGEAAEASSFEVLSPGERCKIGPVSVSLHPAGHVYGSSQVLLEDGRQRWVVTGDFKRQEDPTCAPFVPVRADVLVTEATFALPVYAWEPGPRVAQEIYRWWTEAPERPSILFCYAFGKTQRILGELAKLTERTVYLHGAALGLTDLYREAGIPMVPTAGATEFGRSAGFAGELIIAPPSAHRSPWMRRFKNPQTAFASGWMAIRGARRRRGYERGFVVSDHADWNGLVATVRESGARRVYVTHGHNDTFARYVREELQLQAEPLDTLYQGESE